MNKEQKALDEIRAEFPLFDDADLDQEKHHCEWSVQQDRKRLNTLLDTLQAQPVGAALEAERVAFEAWMHTYDSPPSLEGEVFNDDRYLDADCFGQFVYDDLATQRCWSAWQARAQLAATAGVPDGWRLVPVEPTKEMIEAAFMSEDVAFDSRSIVITDYRAMLAAAPSPAPASDAPEDDQAYDREAERLTAEALGVGAGINPDATSIDDIFLEALAVEPASDVVQVPRRLDKAQCSGMSIYSELTELRALLNGGRV